MKSRKHKAAAKSILLVYILISATFQLGHKDFVPLENNLILSTAESTPHTLGSNMHGLGCPAHNFAQSTHCLALPSQDFSTPRSFSFTYVQESAKPPTAPLRDSSTRAPPQA